MSVTDYYRKGNPYQELFIYYLSGRVPAAAESGLSNFIGNWEEDGFSFLFFSKASRRQIETLLRNLPALHLLDSFNLSYDEWQGAAEAPMKIGRFDIRPPWLTVSDDGGGNGEEPIVLDPGVVFGTGTHATTQDCLEAVATAMDMGHCTSALDLGTGTGLLALAVARCGCRRCLAVDLNALAASTAATNVRLNGYENRVFVIRGKAEQYIDTPAELLIANIHYEIMRQLILSAGFLKKKWFVLSGLMRSDAKAVREHLSKAPVRILRQWSGDGIWYTFLGCSDNVDAGPSI